MIQPSTDDPNLITICFKKRSPFIDKCIIIKFIEADLNVGLKNLLIQILMRRENKYQLNLNQIISRTDRETYPDYYLNNFQWI